MAELKIVDAGNELRLLNMDEASRFLGIRKSTLYDMTMSKRITFVKVGRLNRFRISDLESYIRTRIVERVD